MKQYRFSTVLLGLAVVIALGGCTVSTHESKGESGKKNEDVDIRTPVGSLTVHSGDVDAKDTGLSVYPGARVTTGHKDNDSSANVNINTSFFGVKVVAVKFASDDSPDKILAFYRVCGTSKNSRRAWRAISTWWRFSRKAAAQSSLWCSSGCATAKTRSRAAKCGVFFCNPESRAFCG